MEYTHENFYNIPEDGRLEHIQFSKGDWLPYLNFSDGNRFCRYKCLQRLSALQRVSCQEFSFLLNPDPLLYPILISKILLCQSFLLKNLFKWCCFGVDAETDDGNSKLILLDKDK